jgi:hypothetical protein
MKKIIISSVVIAAIIFSHFLPTILFYGYVVIDSLSYPSKTKIIAYVKNNQEQLLKVAESNEEFKSSMVEDVNRHYDVVDFECGGKGMGSETYYCGFYYSKDDKPSTVWFAGDIIIFNDGWSSTAESGDNTYYTEKITDNWYFYEMHF